MITKAMDERRTKDRILRSLTWMGDSMKGGSQWKPRDKSQAVREVPGKVISTGDTKHRQAVMGDKDRKVPTGLSSYIQECGL